MSAEPVENLELRAVEQRNRLHQTTSELKGKISETREQLDPGETFGNILQEMPPRPAYLPCSSDTDRRNVHPALMRLMQH